RRLCHELQRGSGAMDAAALLAALAESVSWAKDWQGPDRPDLALAPPAARAALRRVAEAVAAAPAAAWWWAPTVLDDQHYVEWIDAGHDFSPALTGAPAKLGAWRRDTVERE